MHTYEIEIKTLLGAPEHADSLRARMKEYDPTCALVSKNNQLNHYFEGGDMEALYTHTKELFDEAERVRLEHIIKDGKSFSVRTREIDGVVKLVVKASIDDTTSENGISRIEFEESVELTLDALDQKLLDAGFQYQAKWSREREEYKMGETNVCLDKNAGYGYLAEFERIIDDPALAEGVRTELETLMRTLEVEELSQERLARMFDHYNQHWPEYYGTEKIFVIE